MTALRPIPLLLLAALALGAAEPPADGTMRIDLLREDAVIASVVLPLAGGTAERTVPGVGTLSVACPAPTAADGVVIYRDVAIALVEPGDGVAVTTALSASFARGGADQPIGTCARGRFTVSFPPR